jgi:hydroxyacylglutathione hydrolase
VEGALRIRVHEVPGHTPGSVLLEWEGRLLTGDTLFWGGSGNCRNGGDPVKLARSFLSVFPRLPDTLEVHPGHDYAEANFAFVLDLEPGNASARSRLDAARASRIAGEEPRPPTLGEERRANPFLRAGDLAVRAAVARRISVDSRATDGEVFVALRQLRDRG